MNVLIRDFLSYESVQQPGGQPRVFRLFRNQGSSRLNRQEVEFFCCRSIEQPTDRFARDPNRVHGSQTLAAALYGTHDFVHVSRFKRSIALANLHL
jgi:hypothetical protein